MAEGGACERCSCTRYGSGGVARDAFIVIFHLLFSRCVLC
jgi:hypothetical protein